jgi:hypothetical protein
MKSKKFILQSNSCIIFQLIAAWYRNFTLLLHPKRTANFNTKVHFAVQNCSTWVDNSWMRKLLMTLKGFVWKIETTSCEKHLQVQLLHALKGLHSAFCFSTLILFMKQFSCLCEAILLWKVSLSLQENKTISIRVHVCAMMSCNFSCISLLFSFSALTFKTENEEESWNEMWGAQRQAWKISEQWCDWVLCKFAQGKLQNRKWIPDDSDFQFVAYTCNEFFLKSKKFNFSRVSSRSFTHLSGHGRLNKKHNDDVVENENAMWVFLITIWFKKSFQFSGGVQEFQEFFYS